MAPRRRTGRNAGAAATLAVLLAAQSGLPGARAEGVAPGPVAGVTATPPPAITTIPDAAKPIPEAPKRRLRHPLSTASPATRQSPATRRRRRRSRPSRCPSRRRPRRPSPRPCPARRRPPTPLPPRPKPLHRPAPARPRRPGGRGGGRAPRRSELQPDPPPERQAARGDAGLLRARRVQVGLAHRFRLVRRRQGGDRPAPGGGRGRARSPRLSDSAPRPAPRHAGRPGRGRPEALGGGRALCPRRPRRAARALAPVALHHPRSSTFPPPTRC